MAKNRTFLEALDNFSRNIRPEQKNQFIVLRDKETKEIADICEIGYRQTGTMSPMVYFRDSMNLLLNPTYNGEVLLEPITIDNSDSYCPDRIERVYDVERMSRPDLLKFIEEHDLKEKISPFYASQFKQ